MAGLASAEVKGPPRCDAIRERASVPSDALALAEAHKIADEGPPILPCEDAHQRCEYHPQKRWFHGARREDDRPKLSGRPPKKKLVATLRK